MADIDNAALKRTALYGTNATPGDTAVLAGAGGPLAVYFARGSDALSATFDILYNQNGTPTALTGFAVLAGLVGNISGLKPHYLRFADTFKALKAVAVTAGTPVSVWTPAAGKKFVLLGGMLSLSVAGSVILEDATGGVNEFIRTPLMAAGVGLVLPPLGIGYLSTAANNGLFLDVTASGSVSGFLMGVEE